MSKVTGIPLGDRKISLAMLGDGGRKRASLFLERHLQWIQ